MTYIGSFIALFVGYYLLRGSTRQDSADIHTIYGGGSHPPGADGGGLGPGALLHEEKQYLDG